MGAIKASQVTALLQQIRLVAISERYKQRDECTNTSLEPRIYESLFYLTTISCHVLSDCLSYQRSPLSGLPVPAAVTDTRQLSDKIRISYILCALLNRTYSVA